MQPTSIFLFTQKNPAEPWEAGGVKKIMQWMTSQTYFLFANEPSLWQKGDHKQLQIGITGNTWRSCLLQI